MLEHTKKPPVELKFVGPPRNKEKAIQALKGLGFTEVRDTISWEELFPEYTKVELPGVILAGSRIKEGLTQKRLSELTGISRHHISEMENGKRPIEKNMAKALAKALNVGFKIFL
ncbi:helix-turn-helix domain-containing protein [Desulfonema magnum]|uniref:HTH domain-containing protein, Cro/C1-type n=1 Tax=Desulfonema magnum TaxID=45655 RepID=A0A975GKL8_9BACT|nr:helix-turn-helix domain-containing protein [Desulfonema magnum]QTA84645.1 HTH domain-containing protein, Cro/C1-type [Desulfonema magnum]